MRIEELILEGFKSYPVRTQITGWDASFNAITGLNGSGKSNILDAICFVLGMTNVSQMRASNLQDLIYKRGQAGVTKASVTVVFDNSERSTSPVGFENCRQITVTRQIALPNISKYLLNGHKTQQHIVQTLFQSVQLNINNPHFLIMQGRITKVLNMRPQEILGMVEEAAGTRMFEERKDKAKKTMDKKEKRVQEITSLLEEEITPKLDKLRADKRSFLAYQQATSEIERLARVLRAWEWKEANERVKRKDADIEKKEREATRFRDERKIREDEGVVAQRQKKEAEKRRNEELKKGGKFKQREEEVKSLEIEVVKLRTQAENKQGSLDDDEKRVKSLEQDLNELESSLTAKCQQIEDLKAAHSTNAEEHSTAQASLSKSEELLQSLLTGLSNTSGTSGAGGGGGYMGQLADAKARIARESAEEEQLRRKLTMSQKELAELEKKWKKVEGEAAEMRMGFEKGRKELDGMKAAFEKIAWDEEREKAAVEQVSHLKARARECSEKCDALRQQLGSLNFTYSDPSPTFDRSTVKGLVATLVSLPDKHFDKSTALEIAAGGRLYNVVVQDEMVGKNLLQNGKLKKRVTIIPLNKINAFKASAAKLQATNQLVGDKANLALTLIGYDKDVSAAMAYVFGDTLICADAASAKAVTFDPKIAMKSVTLDGDVYDPSGTLSGGAAPTSSGLLKKVKELNDVEIELNAAKTQLAKLEKEDAKLQAVKTKWKDSKRAVEIKEHEITLLREQVESSNAVRIGTSVDELKTAILQLQESIEGSRSKQAEAEAECKQLSKDMSDFKNNKEGKIVELKATIAKQKAALQKLSVVVKTHQKEMQTAKLELEQIERDIVASKRGIEEARKGVAKILKELDAIQNELLVIEGKHAAAEQKLKQERATLTRFDAEINELDEVIKAKEQAVSDIELSIKRVEHEVQTLQKDRVSSNNAISTLEKAYEWIVDEKKHFGKEGTPYDFRNINIQQSREKCGELEHQMKGMKKSVNKAVMAMLETVEKKESSLKKMLTTVMKDKVKIEDTIAELDRYKRDALQKTWEKVNGDFGSIFSELLPGNFAKLQPPEGQDLTQGLEVKVQLGSVWKQSLTELSGGQRSLIALSLIMSLLQFKPAPMYILDEIDAALDLSHTQHIGQLFRSRFKGSQFIVVSLKEGLFTNANVLFRARFVDGTSVVQRTVQRTGSTLYSSSGHDGLDKENDPGLLQTPKASRGGRRAVAVR